MQALDFVTGLIDPDPSVRNSFNPSLADDLRVMSRGELFDMAMSICCALVADPQRCTTSLWRPANKDEYARFSPEVLSRVGRALLDWPGAFHRLAETVRGSSEARSGHFGIRKELGPLLAITQDGSIPSIARQLIRRKLDDNMVMTADGTHRIRRTENRHRSDLLTQRDAAEILNCTRRLVAKLSRHPDVRTLRAENTIKGPKLLDRGQIECIAALKPTLVPSQAVAVQLGIPRAALAELSERRLLLRETGPVTVLLMGNDYYHGSSVEALIANVERLVRTDEPPAAFVRITKGINRIPEAPLCFWATRGY